MYERILPTIQAIRNIQTLLRKTPMSHYIYRLFINFLLIHYFIYRLVRWSDPQYLPLCQKELCIRSPAVTRIEYSCAVTPQVRQTGNRLSGLAGTAYASLLA